MDNAAFLKELKLVAEKIDEKISQLLLPSFSSDANLLFDAMKYSVVAASKKIRGFLLIKTADIFGVDRQQSLKIAAAIEMIHTYSLIHDDLPAIDNDDYRRGKPSCHKKFGEATAILAGDALLTYAFEVLASDQENISCQIRVKIIQEITNAIGVYGMIGGQMIDINAKNFDLAVLHEVHALKTGKLIAAACVSGAILGGANQAQIDSLRSYSEKLGLIFQMVDDLLDAADDQKNGNMSLLKLMSVSDIRHEIKQKYNSAILDLQYFKETSFLQALLCYLIETV